MTDFLQKVKESLDKHKGNEAQATSNVSKSTFCFKMNQKQFAPNDQNWNYKKPTPAPHIAGKPGGGWDEMETQKVKQNLNIQQHSMQGQKHQQLPQNQMSNNKQSQQSGKSSCDYEKKLIEDLTAPGGVRSKPPDKILQDFVNRCKLLDEQVILDSLLNKVQTGEKNSQIKALHIIQALITNEDYESYRQYLITKKEILSQVSSPISLQIIDIIKETSAQRSNLLSSIQQAKPQQKVQEVDLIGVGDEQDEKPQQANQFQGSQDQLSQNKTVEILANNQTQQLFDFEDLISLDFGQIDCNHVKEYQFKNQQKKQLQNKQPINVKEETKSSSLIFPSAQQDNKQQQYYILQDPKAIYANSQIPAQYPHYIYFQQYQIQSTLPLGNSCPQNNFLLQQNVSYKHSQNDVSKLKIAQVQPMKDQRENQKEEDDFKDVFSFK